MSTRINKECLSDPFSPTLVIKITDYVQGWIYSISKLFIYIEKKTANAYTKCRHMYRHKYD